MQHHFLRTNAIYALGNVASSAAFFLLIPYLVNTLTPEEYGAWSIFEVVILILNMVLLAGMEVGLMREYWFQRDEEQRRQLFGTVLIAAIIWGSVWFVVVAFLLKMGVLIPLLNDTLMILEVIAIAWVEAVLMLFLTLFRIREQALTFVFLSAGRAILFVGLSIGLVRLGFGLSGVLHGRLVSALLASTVSLTIARHLVSLKLDRSKLRRILRYGLPLLPSNAASYILQASDRYVLQYFASLESVAVYSFAYKIAAALDVMVTRPFALDWAPRRFKIATQSNPAWGYAQALLFYLWAAVLFSLFIVAIAPTLYAWFAPHVYWSGIGIIPIILLAYLIYGLSYPLNVGIMLKDRTQYLPIIGWIAALLCLGLNFWWIPRYGVLGAAWATVVAYGLWTTGIAWISLRLYPIRYPLFKVLSALVAGVAGYMGLQVLDRILPLEGNPLLMAFIRSVWVLLIASVGILYIVQPIRSTTRQMRSKP